VSAPSPARRRAAAPLRRRVLTSPYMPARTRASAQNLARWRAVAALRRGNRSATQCGNLVVHACMHARARATPTRKRGVATRTSSQPHEAHCTQTTMGRPGDKRSLINHTSRCPRGLLTTPAAPGCCVQRGLDYSRAPMATLTNCGTTADPFVGPRERGGAVTGKKKTQHTKNIRTPS
jgi:hypothetical protein